MQILKKLMIGLLAIALGVGGLGFGSAASQETRAGEQEEKTEGDWRYKVWFDGTAEIRGYDGNEEKLEIPETIDGHKVDKIGTGAFSDCTSLKNVTISDNVTSIGFWAFGGCTSLESVVVPDSVTVIGRQAFGYMDYQSGELIKYPDFTIYGYPGTAAEAYAKENGFTFLSLQDENVDGSITLNFSGECLPKLEMTKDEVVSAIASFFTKEQLFIQAGVPLDIWLMVSGIDESVSDVDKDLIAKAIADLPDNKKLNYKVLHYLDIRLDAVIDVKEWSITGTDGEIRISVALEKPANETYKVVRIHDGKAEVLDAQLDKDSKRLIFQTDKFSTYAIIYSDIASGGDTPNAMVMAFLLAGLAVMTAGVVVVIKAFKADGAAEQR